MKGRWCHGVHFQESPHGPQKALMPQKECCHFSLEQQQADKQAEQQSMKTQSIKQIDTQSNKQIKMQSHMQINKQSNNKHANQRTDQ